MKRKGRTLCSSHADIEQSYLDLVSEYVFLGQINTCVGHVCRREKMDDKSDGLWYNQWWAQLTEKLGSLTGNQLTKMLASLTLKH